MNWIKEIFGTAKPIIGMIHIKSLPGTPLYDEKGGVEKLIHAAKLDYVALTQGGIDAVMFCNEYDKPYLHKVGPEIIAAMTHIVSEVSRDGKIPFGVDVQWDPIAAIAVAHATGAAFVRGIFTGVYGSDLGLLNTSVGEILRFRKSIGANNVKLLYNIVPEFSEALGQRPIEKVAKTVAVSSLADVICVSGYMSGEQTPLEELKKVKEALPSTPVFANTGVRKETVADILKIADGCIVATCLKKNNKSCNPICMENVKEFMKVVYKVREEL